MTVRQQAIPGRRPGCSRQAAIAAAGLSVAASLSPAQPVLNPANGHYYEAVPGVIGWEDARATAAAREYAGLPGHLATLVDAGESGFVVAALGGISLRGFHIGGYQAESCSGQGAGWSWVTGELWDWTNWDSGEPNGPVCGDRLELTWSQIGFADGRWNDIDPSSTNATWVRGYIVEYAPRRIYLNPSNGHYYERVDAAVTWDSAACLAAGQTAHGLRGYLATITSPAELAWVTATFGGADLRGVHLGGYQLPGSAEPGGGWAWVTNEPWAWSNWGQGEPNNQYGDDRLEFMWRPELFADGAWNDIPHNWLVRDAVNGYQVRGYLVEYSEWSTFVVQPQPVSRDCGGPGTMAEFTASAQSPTPFTYRWQRGGVDLSDGPTPWGSLVSGAGTPTLRITDLGWGDAGLYRCIATGACASHPSGSAELMLCAVNCDCSVLMPVLNIGDFVCFLNRYAAGDPSANCDRSTTPPVLNVNDFVCFQASYAAGCP